MAAVRLMFHTNVRNLLKNLLGSKGMKAEGTLGAKPKIEGSLLKQCVFLTVKLVQSSLSNNVYFL